MDNVEDLAEPTTSGLPNQSINPKIFMEQANATQQEGMPTTSHPLPKQHAPGARIRCFNASITSNQGGARQEGISTCRGDTRNNRIDRKGTNRYPQERIKTLVQTQQNAGTRLSVAHHPKHFYTKFTSPIYAEAGGEGGGTFYYV